MKTQVIMMRPFLDGEVSQQSKTGLFSATELVAIGNKKRQKLGKSNFQLISFLNQKSTKYFIEELSKESNVVVKKTGKGRASKTWVHPLLLIDIALALDSKLKVTVYEWMYDQLLKYRNDSGDSYKKMTGAIYDRFSNKGDFHKSVPKIANYIRQECGVKEWQQASEKQLQLRDKMHENISLLCSVMPNYKQAILLGVKKAKEELIKKTCK